VRSLRVVLRQQSVRKHRKQINVQSNLAKGRIAATHRVPASKSRIAMNHPAFAHQQHSITAVCLVLISCPTEDRRLSYDTIRYEMLF